MMGREVIGDCSSDPEFGEYETERTIKYLKQVCGQPSQGVDIRVTWEGCEIGNGDETQYPVISVVWDEGVPCPDEYIEKCGEAFERFDTPEEIYERDREWMRLIREIQTLPEKLLDVRAKARSKHHFRASRRHPQARNSK
jgi:hypothetical protein